MAKHKNKHGLTRSIPSAVKFEVRRRCGFGCVICGTAIVDYDHVEPEFANATVHDPAGIALLCKKHHGERTCGFINKQIVLDAMKAPKALSDGFVRTTILFGPAPVRVSFGSSSVSNVHIPLIVKGHPLIRLWPPEVEGAPHRISARFLDGRGRLVARIDENEWSAPAKSAADIVATAGRLTVLDRPGHVAIELQLGELDELRITQLDMIVSKLRVYLDPEGAIRAEYPSGARVELRRIAIHGGYGGIEFA